ncbi:alpha/beta fold hydrolase [Fulvivirga ulvae]|uniref:YheT family hydrolase n=1 Tax=Fulvivirga ulvae TaxID=2904245 RepID=UPI001F470D17|nr:alpha/beta fold hydrolase [Fulvivirga ulvae]UII30859.1 alpha/beta fold hydrolase [Fulvivirga ulvae]
MPLVQSKYKPPFYLKNGHLATVVPSAFRRVSDVEYIRERITTADGDFLDLDWSTQSSEKLIIISHGLEGSANRPYVKGMTKYFYRYGWDTLAWNCRSCSGEINSKARFYHHGDSEDLARVVEHAIGKSDYSTVVLVGFSMGGSMTLKYLGEMSDHIMPQVRGGAVFSVPVDLGSSVAELARRSNNFYRRRFLKKLEKKIKLKAVKYPDEVQYTGFDNIRYFPDFDNMYTAPLHGFKDAEDFYNKASAKQYMYNVKRPTLLVNAWNDPFLPEACYPQKQCEKHNYLYFESPEYGGHVGFTLKGSEFNYMEHRALQFFNENID